MAELKDEQALLLLLKAPKKKYIKHLLEYSACLELYHNCPPPNFKTPLIETFQSDLELTTEQSHRLLLSLSNLVSTAFALNFNFSSSSPFSQQFDPQLKQILLQSLTALQSQLSESRLDTMRMGNKLVDINWKLDLQVASQKGKANIPSVSIEIQSVNQTAGLEREKIWMRGQQFLAFFGNLGKIRESLLGLVGEKKEGQGRNGGQVK